MYKEDLLWVWTGWGVSIISTNSGSPPINNIHSQVPEGILKGVGCGGILMTTRNCGRCWNTLYMYEEDLLWVWREWGVSIISTNRHLPPINNIHSSSPNSSYKAGSASLWPLATVTGAEIHYIYICMKLICWEVLIITWHENTYIIFYCWGWVLSLSLSLSPPPPPLSVSLSESIHQLRVVFTWFPPTAYT